MNANIPKGFDIKKLRKEFEQMFDVDSIRFTSPIGKNVFLIIGEEKEDEMGRFLDERVAAIGGTPKELVKNAKAFKVLWEKQKKSLPSWSRASDKIYAQLKSSGIEPL